MLLQKTFLEVKKLEKIYHLICDPTSSLGELHDVLAEMKDYIVGRINAAHAASVTIPPTIPTNVADSSVTPIQVPPHVS